MEKNWLIRTKSNHILGPISKEKVLDLYKNGSIKLDDELCSGNGYWFFIREEDMVEKYLVGNDIQGFNPISEAKDILTASLHAQGPIQVKESITMVGALNVSMLQPNDVAVPPVPEPDLEISGLEVKSEDLKKKNDLVSKNKNSKKSKKKNLENQNYLKYFGFAGFILLVLLIYYRKLIMRKIFDGEITFNIHLIQESHAQEEAFLVKKKF